MSATAASIYRRPLWGLLGTHIYAGIRRYSCILYCDINTVLPADQYREKQKGTKESRKAQIFLVNHLFSLCKISRSSRNKIRKRDKIPSKYSLPLANDKYTENLNVKFKFKGALPHRNEYRVNLYHIVSLFPPNFRKFGAVPVEKFQKHGCIIGWWESSRLIP